MQPQLCNALNEINNYITLTKPDRTIYTNDYDTVRNFLTNKMKENDENFKRLYNGHRLGGSYADNVKVSKPNEFDVVLHLKIIERNLVKILPDEKLPGYVKINLTDVFNKIKTETHNQKLYQQLKKLVNANNYLVIKNTQSWFESIVTRIIPHRGLKFTENCCHYTLNYRKCGPAHTIEVNADWREFSIDFVPGFIFDENKWVATQKIPPYIPKCGAIWCAIPKPIYGNFTSDTDLSLISSYVDIERCLITNKNNLKNTLRMLKKIRDVKNLNNLKSYYIKTVFLFENEIQDFQFWNKPVSTVLKHMFDRLLEYFEKQNLPFFWDRKFNLLSKLDTNQIVTLHSQLRSVYKTLWNASDSTLIYSIFLTPEEMRKFKQTSLIDSEEKKQDKSETKCILM